VNILSDEEQVIIDNRLSVNAGLANPEASDTTIIRRFRLAEITHSANTIAASIQTLNVQHSAPTDLIPPPLIAVPPTPPLQCGIRVSIHPFLERNQIDTARNKSSAPATCLASTPRRFLFSPRAQQMQTDVQLGPNNERKKK
jgi:hypothetical protein